MSNLKYILETLKVINGNLVSEKRRVVVMGGGPVGLFTAVKFLNSGLFDVKLFELRPKYTREEIFMLQNNVFYEILRYFPKAVLNKLVDKGCFILPPPFDLNGSCFRSVSDIEYYLDGSRRPDKVRTNYPARLLGVKISIFEEVLYKYLEEKNGIKIFRPSEMNPNKAKIEVNKNDWSVEYDDGYKKIRVDADDYDVIVGTEGGNSPVRDKLLDDAKNPSTGEEVFAHYLVDNSKIQRADRGKIIGSKNDKTSYVKDYFPYRYKNSLIKPVDKYKVGYGVVGYLDVEKGSRLYEQKMQGVLDQIRFVDLDNLKEKDENIMKGDVDNTTSSLLDNFGDFNIKTEMVRGNLVVNSNEYSPQHRYRFFSSKIPDWYFGVNCSIKEYDSILASILNVDPGLESRDPLNIITVRNFKKGIIMKNKDLYLSVSLLIKFYNLGNIDELKDLIRISSLPIVLYKSSYYISSKVVNNKTKLCFIGGDAGIGVHFFSGTGVNTGIKSVNSIIDTIIEYTEMSKHDDIYNNINSILVEINERISKISDEALGQSLNVTLDFDRIEKTEGFFKIEDYRCKYAQNEDCKRREQFINYSENLIGKSIGGNILRMTIRENDIKAELARLYLSQFNLGS